MEIKTDAVTGMTHVTNLISMEVRFPYACVCVCVCVCVSVFMHVTNVISMDVRFIHAYI
jgi:hypothetical protein